MKDNYRHLQPHTHTTHPDIVIRLKRATGHLQKVITMIEAQRNCIDITQQLHAVEKAISAAKKMVIHDHLDHCVQDIAEGGAVGIKKSISEFKDITKYL